MTIGEEHFGAAGETTSAEASVRFNAADKLAVRADITVFTTMSVWDESTQSHLKDYIVTFEAQADDPNVTLGFGLMQEDHPPITVDGSKLFEHVALDFGAKEMTINRDTTVKFEDLDIELPEYFEWTSVAVIAVPLATSDGSEFKGTYTYDLVTTVLR